MFSVASLSDLTVEVIQKFFLACLGFNLLLSGMLLFIRHFSLHAVQWMLFIGGILDGLILAMLVLLTNGFQSLLYWFFPALILRNALSLPLAGHQLTLNFAVSFFYLGAGLLQAWLTRTELVIAEVDNQLQIMQHLGLTNKVLLPAMDSRVRTALGMEPANYQPEPFVLRVIVLFLVALICYGLQILLEKQRLADEEAREFAERQGQLAAAGRLSAEIAHQLKNPLSIINNSAFNLQRLIQPNQELMHSQVGIIREEVERADRIITELMGYAKLADGRVEKLEVVPELNRALEIVFPPAGQYPVEVVRRFEPGLPALMMQRGHLGEILVNILQNAREAMAEGGRLEVTARLREDDGLEISIADSGPGIPPERQTQIFEAYYTTKSKGTGLGLAIVRQSLDFYGARARVESELGKGARFVLDFPARTLAVSQ
jgi:signal transduction histidine kinase